MVADLVRLAARWFILLGGLALSVLLTAVLWPRGVVAFLVLPFLLPFGRRATPTHTCPRCGWSTTGTDARFCPRDGASLS